MLYKISHPFPDISEVLGPLCCWHFIPMLLSRTSMTSKQQGYEIMEGCNT